MEIRKIDPLQMVKEGRKQAGKAIKIENHVYVILYVHNHMYINFPMKTIIMDCKCTNKN